MLADREFRLDGLPPGYEWLEQEPVFDPEKHLALQEPTSVRSVSDLGYPAEFCAHLVSDLGVTAPFRVLSESGVVALRGVIDQLRPHIRRNPTTNRVPAVMRGSAFRSRFIREFSFSPLVVDQFSRLAGTPLRPTLFEHQLAHLNFAPEVVSKPVNGWHYDVNSLVMVLMVHDPADIDGGQFAYFNGPRWEARELLRLNGALPEDRLVTPQFPAAGFAVLMQGCAVMHQAQPLRSAGERISLVTSFDSLDVRLHDPNRFFFVTGGFGSQNADARLERACRYTEWLRYNAWRCRAKLGTLMEAAPYSEDRELMIRLAREAIADMTGAIHALERGDIAREEALALRALADAEVETMCGALS